MQLLIALAAGTLFGAGLTISQMINPQKVLNFLDLAAIPAGGWDPTLLMVFAGALPVMFAAYAVQRQMAKPVLGGQFTIPTKRQIDAPLVLGTALFGIGWGLAGICPGPSIAAIALAGIKLPLILLFVVSMLAGMALSRLTRRQAADGAPLQA